MREIDYDAYITICIKDKKLNLKFNIFNMHKICTICTWNCFKLYFVVCMCVQKGEGGKV